MDGKGQIFKRETSARKAEAPCADTVGWQGNAITWAKMAGAENAMGFTGVKQLMEMPC